MTISKHYQYERNSREKFIEEHLHGDGYAIDYFIVDRNHPDGAEIHTVTDNGIIIIHNYKTGAMVTKLIARRGQIERLYRDSGKEPPQWLLELADWHRSLGYNK